MSNIFLHIYDYLQSRRRLCLGGLVGLLGVLLLMVSTISYNENIFNFLPLSDNYKKSIAIYQDISGGRRVVVMFKQKDDVETTLPSAIQYFTDKLCADTLTFPVSNLISQVDLDYYLDLTDFIYANLPVMLVDSDYLSMQRILSQPQEVEQKLQTDMQSLMSQGSIVDEGFIRRDPLQLFSPVMERLERRQASLPFVIHEGLIYTHDRQYALVMFDSPYGPLESADNARLVEAVEELAATVHETYPTVEIDITGAPVISVDNARLIKSDSFCSISIALVLILALLLYALRRVRSLLFISFAILFGWLFAMGFLAVFRSDVSLIVLGIGSIIIGIAVNYPLHFIAHVGCGGSVRMRLKEMISPLLIGNITTVGAFATLIPLDSPALRDLGLFASFMLVGTILFVLVFLPQMVNTEVQCKETEHEELWLFRWFTSLRPQFSRWGVIMLSVLTLFLGYNSFDTSFDADITHINYLSDEQQQLLDDLGVSAGLNDSTSLYVVTEGTTWDDALLVHEELGIHQLSDFICSTTEQQRRIDRWHNFWHEYRDQVEALLNKKGPQVGFSNVAFSDFYRLIDADYRAHDLDYFDPIRSLLFPNSFSTETGSKAVVGVLEVAETDADVLAEQIADRGFVFDLPSLNRSVAQSLSSDFNYIGWVCGFIVFLFLWCSFGRLELSLMAFLPMAMGWLWILGIMHLFDIQFNIVNVILATFIFGQGDDYTIFITEGLITEYAYRKRVLQSFKSSILVSALIMFIGMGSLIIADHPVLYSLAQVTIIGMGCVVVMAWVVPSVIFSWLIYDDVVPRPIPLTLSDLFRRRTAPFELGHDTHYYHDFLIGQYIYKGIGLERETRSMLKRYDDFSQWIDGYQLPDESISEVHILRAGRGQFSLLFAWVHPEIDVYSHCSDPDDAALLQACSLRPANLHVVLDKENEPNPDIIGTCPSFVPPFSC